MDEVNVFYIILIERCSETTVLEEIKGTVWPSFLNYLLTVLPVNTRISSGDSKKGTPD